MGAIYRREMGAFFSSSIAYVFLAVFYLTSGYFFYSGSLYSATTDMSSTFTSLFLIIVILIPILTMRLFSEEKKQKTEQGLLTSPVSIGGIVMGKYFAALTMYTIGITILLVYAVILSFFGTVTWGIVIANVLALFLVGAAFIAVTIFISSLTENQVVAAVLGIIVLLVLYMLDVFATYLSSIPILPDVLNALSFYTRYYEFTVGLFDPASVLFYISTAVLFNFFTVRVYERRRWS
ncbi:MAG: ABC transporter permease [Ruminococcus sp.]|nr:ABC transporter permease [Ruminococcus sp.]